MSLNSTLRAGLAALFLSGPAFAHTAWAEVIGIHEPYAISASPSAQTGAAFMIIHNHGTTDDALIGVRSDAARLVELHEHSMTADGVMSMRAVTEPVPLPADGTLLLERGGYHIMFMGLAAPFEQDMILNVTLIFEVAGEIEVEVPVDLTRLDRDGAMEHGMEHSE